MNNKDFDKLHELLGGENEDRREYFTDIEELFSPCNEAWKVLFHEAKNDEKKALSDFLCLNVGFEDCFRGHLKYRKWRIDFEKVYASNVGWSYYNIQTSYLETRKLISNCKEYQWRQKIAYLAMMSAGLLTAIQEESMDEEFRSFFMASALCKQAINDREVILRNLRGNALCKCYPDMFSALENPKFSASYLDV